MLSTTHSFSFVCSGASLSCFLVARKPPLAPTCTHCTQPRSHRFISSSTLSSKYLPRTALPSMKKTLETRSLLVSRSNGHIHDRSNCYYNITITYIWNSTVCACVERSICGRGFEKFRRAQPRDLSTNPLLEILPTRLLL